MPEFILDMGSPDGARSFGALDAFTQGYLEAAFFTSTGNLEDEGLESASVAELAQEALASAVADCAVFQATAADLLNAAYERDYDAEQAGRDFWFTRNGHGVGYCDRKALEPDSDEYESLTAIMVANRDNNAVWDAACAKRSALSSESIGAKLSERARAAGEVDMYRGDDSQIYFSR